MSKTSLTLATGMHERARPLAEGRVRCEGFDLTTVMLKANGPRHERFLAGEFDAAEFSFALFLKCWSEDPDFAAIPVFLNRQFRHGAIFVNTAAGIRTPKDLEGRTIGVTSWFNTAALWARGVLEHEYGVDLARIDWVTGESGEGGRLSRPAGATLTDARSSLVELLVAGELDALITPRTIARNYRPKVERLFPAFRDVERSYFEKTGIFPMSHVLVVRTPLLQRHEMLAAEIFEACERAKALANEYADDPEHSMLAWFGAEWEEEVEVFGADPWVNGIDPNRKTLEGLVEYGYSSGLLSRKPAIEELFHLSARNLGPQTK
jgi:4,5-dihydroxyphthalate decarboxylase